MAAPEIGTPLGEALRLARRGFRVVFLHAPVGDGCSCGSKACDASRGKHPVLGAWQKNASSDEPTILDQYRRVRDQLNIEPNLGIALGAFGDRYAIAIDVDDDERLIVLSEEHGALPVTLTGHSARGARLFFVLPPDAQLERIKNVTALGGTPGVDVKVRGGQVAVAPSRHFSGTAYSWVDPGAEVAELPSAWVLAIQSRPAPPKWAAAYTPSMLLTDAKAQRKAKGYLQSAVHSESRLVARAAEGGRNSALHHAACAMFPLVQGLCLGVEHGWVVRELSGAAKSAGLSDVEIRRTIASAEKWQLETGAVRVPFALSDGEPAAAPALHGPDPNDIELLEDSGRPAPISGNVVRMLARYPRGQLQYDEFGDRIIWPDGAPIGDHDPAAIQEFLFQQPTHQRVRASIETIWSAALQAAMRTQIHPVRDYLRALPRWDENARADILFSHYFGAPDTPQLRGYAQCFLIGAVARIMRPGCQLDTMPVLEGAQGIRKSTAIRVLAGDWFSDTPIPDRAPDCYQQLRGVWLYELAELASIKGREVERIKAFVSSRVDRYRRSYGRGVGEVPRHVAFVGTTNASAYLTDDTGNRRYHPVPCGHINLKELSADRDQLWAEAFQRWTRGEAWWLSDALVAAQSDDVATRTSHDTWSDALDDLDPDVNAITGKDLLTRFGIEVGKQTRGDEMRLAAILKRAGWSQHQSMRNGLKARYWFRPGTLGR